MRYYTLLCATALLLVASCTTNVTNIVTAPDERDGAAPEQQASASATADLDAGKGDADAGATAVDECEGLFQAAGEGSSFAWSPTAPPFATSGKPVCWTVPRYANLQLNGHPDLYPIVASGGDLPNPVASITAAPNSTQYQFQMTKAGVFGFRCPTQPKMRGAIKVLP